MKRSPKANACERTGDVIRRARGPPLEAPFLFTLTLRVKGLNSKMDVFGHADAVNAHITDIRQGGAGTDPLSPPYASNRR